MQAEAGRTDLGHIEIGGFGLLQPLGAPRGKGEFISRAQFDDHAIAAALAHRIPLYVPQRMRTEDLDQYNGLTWRTNEAFESGQWEEHGVLFYEQNSFVVISR